MTFTINSITRCAGTNHWKINVTVVGTPIPGLGETFDLHVTASEMTTTFDPAADVDETKRRMLQKMRGHLAGQANWAAVQALLIGNNFTV